jgi:hypothetical protein
VNELWWVLIALGIAAIPMGYLIYRFRSKDEELMSGSDGEDWGPHSTTPRQP